MQLPSRLSVAIVAAVLFAAGSWAVLRRPASLPLHVASHAVMKTSAGRAAPPADSIRDARLERSGRRRAAFRDFIGQMRTSAFLRR
jgi:hypothetical protein